MWKVVMSKPSDQESGKDGLPDKEARNIRKIGMLDPGFRNAPDPSTFRPAFLRIKGPTNRQDRKNLAFVLVALSVAVAIFCALEFKQMREAAHEAAKSAESLLQNN